MKKFKYFICFSLAFICIIGFGGCFLNDLFNSVSITTPTITLDAEENTISWNWDYDAKKYILYDGNVELDTFETEETTPQIYSISIESYLTEYKEYNFKVTAYVSDTVNKTSNTIKFMYQDPSVEKNALYGNVVNGSEYAPQNLTYTSSTYNLSWDTVDGATKYYVCAIYSTDKIYSFETAETNANVFNYLSSDITVFRVASSLGGEDSYFSDDQLTINLNNIEDVYKKVFFFNGNFHDYYAKSSQEFISILYYSFIAKNETVDVRFSPEGLTDVMGSETYLTDSTIQNYINAITETCYYNFDYKKYSMYKYRFTFDFKNVYEPIETNSNSYTSGSVKHTTYQSNLLKPNYENFVFSGDREETYNDFASDKQIILVMCETSEELYWAVESGATPVFVANTCTAYKIYNNAKAVLRDIIKSGMGEYDKVLSLYDYIAYNSVYDFGAYYNSSSSSTNSTKYTCFYLESLLNNNTTKVAVCDGYSKTFSLLCNMENIDCYRVTGMANTTSGFGAHAWNKVKVNGSWYVADITWTEYTRTSGTTITGSNLTQSDYEILGHSYFLVNDDFVADNHYAYASAKDRARFVQDYNLSKFNAYFPAVYMNVQDNDSDEYYSYFEATYEVDNGLTGYVTKNRVISSIEDAKLLVKYLQANNVDNAEIIIPSTVDSSVVTDITDYLIDSRTSVIGTNTTDYTVYSIGDYSISSSTKSLSGTIYIFGKGTVDSVAA